MVPLSEGVLFVLRISDHVHEIGGQEGEQIVQVSGVEQMDLGGLLLNMFFSSCCPLSGKLLFETKRMSD